MPTSRWFRAGLALGSGLLLALFIALLLDLSLLLLHAHHLRQASQDAAQVTAQQALHNPSLGALELTARQYLHLRGYEGVQVRVELCPADNSLPRPSFCDAEQDSAQLRLQLRYPAPTLFLHLWESPLHFSLQTEARSSL